MSNGAFAAVRRTRLAENGQNAPADSGRGIDARNGGSVDASDSFILDNRSDGVGVLQQRLRALNREHDRGQRTPRRRRGGYPGQPLSGARPVQHHPEQPGIAALSIVTNHGDYRTGSGMIPVDFPDNEARSSRSSIRSACTTTAADGDRRQQRRATAISARSTCRLRCPRRSQLRTGARRPGPPDADLLEDRHDGRRPAGVRPSRLAPAARRENHAALPPGSVIIGPFGLRDIENAVCP